MTSKREFFPELCPEKALVWRLVHLDNVPWLLADDVQHLHGLHGYPRTKQATGGLHVRLPLSPFVRIETQFTLSCATSMSRRGNVFERLKKRGFDVLTSYHAEAILTHDMEEACEELEEVLLGTRVSIEEIVAGGGGEHWVTQRIRRRLKEDYGWKKHNFTVKMVIDGKEEEAISHEVDHIKEFAGGTFAIETEWNNKDTFYDRDLANFKAMHAYGVISIGGMITRGSTLYNATSALIRKFIKDKDITTLEQLEPYEYDPTKRQRRMIEDQEVKSDFASAVTKVIMTDKYVKSSTHWSKLEERIGRGVSDPCPIVAIGLPADIVVNAPADQLFSKDVPHFGWDKEKKAAAAKKKADRAAALATTSNSKLPFDGKLT